MSFDGEMPRLTEDEVITAISAMSNWGRWGSDDQRGALNLITPRKIAAAAALVSHGITIPCGRQIEFAPRADPIEAPMPPQHFMIAAGEKAGDGHSAFAFDWVGLPLHGGYITHLDAPSHVFWNGTMYNGMTASLVTTSSGARKGSIDVARDGIVTRGVLLDVASVRGVPSLDDGDGVTKQDLLDAEAAAGVEVQPGDAIFIRTGYPSRRPTGNVVQPGLSTDCLQFIWDRQPSVLATDCATDLHPSGYRAIDAPVHVVTVVGMGVWIIDNGDFEQLSRTAASFGRWEFLASISPLRLKNSTGSPVNPIAVF